MKLKDLVQLVQTSFWIYPEIHVGEGSNLIKAGNLPIYGLRPPAAYIGESQVDKEKLIEQIKSIITDDASRCCSDWEGNFDKDKLEIFITSRIQDNSLYRLFIEDYIQRI